jgi:hypothetical protein
MRVLVTPSVILMGLAVSLAMGQANPVVKHTVLITDNNQMPPKVISQGLVRLETLNSHRGIPRSLRGQDDTQCILKVEVRANGKVSWVTIISAIENQFSGYALEVAFDWRFEPTTRPFVTYITVMYKGSDRPLTRRP